VLTQSVVARPEKTTYLGEFTATILSNFRDEVNCDDFTKKDLSSSSASSSDEDGPSPGNYRTNPNEGINTKLMHSKVKRKDFQKDDKKMNPQLLGKIQKLLTKQNYIGLPVIRLGQSRFLIGSRSICIRFDPLLNLLFV